MSSGFSSSGRLAYKDDLRRGRARIIDESEEMRRRRALLGGPLGGRSFASSAVRGFVEYAASGGRMPKRRRREDTGENLDGLSESVSEKSS